MPTLIRLIITLLFLAGLVYAGMFALVAYVQPTQKEVTVRIPARELLNESAPGPARFAPTPPARQRSSPGVAMSGGHLIGAFLEMMSAERGAAKNTIDAYRRDLADYSGYLSGHNETLLTAGREAVTAYIDSSSAAGFRRRRSARRLSAIRQFHRFLCADGMRGDDPTRIVASPKARRALPKVLSIAEVDKLLTTAEARSQCGVCRCRRRRRRCGSMCCWNCFMPPACACPNWSASSGRR